MPCMENIKIATVFIKSLKLKTIYKSDYFIEDTLKWVVFPHELEELSLEEIHENYGNNIFILIKNRKEKEFENKI